MILQDESIAESSGLARCKHHPDWFWTHNDSGDEARVFLVDSEGKTRAIYRLPGAGAIDWEDMTSFEKDGHSIFGQEISEGTLSREEASPCIFLRNQFGKIGKARS